MEGMSTVRLSEALEQRIVSEFRKPFFQDWDRRFFVILFLTLLIEAVGVVLLSRQPVEVYSEKEIARIQERFVYFILGETSRKEAEIVVSPSPGGVVPAGEERISEEAGPGEAGVGEEGTSLGEGGRAESRRASRVEAIEARRRFRERISREVSNKGLLGLLTGTGSAVEGEAVSSLFTETGYGKGVGEDLDRVLSSVGGLKTGGKSGLGLGEEGGSGVRGERSGRKATIDDLVSDLGGVRSQSLTRRGELKVETPADVVGRGRKSIYRSPEAIQEVLLSHVPAIRYCYERELKRNPALKGKIAVRITVGPDGRVKSAVVVSSTLNNERVERCILARIRLWKDFKPIDLGEGDVTFRQVYAFGY